jgi:hypothetical protein
MDAYPLFAGYRILFAGACTGFIFGFLLRKGHVTRFETIVGQFLLRDFTVVRVMISAIVVGGLGLYAALNVGLIESLPVRPFVVYGNLLGGLIAGAGMAVLGYCPGTGVAALGDGARDAIYGVAGMICGAALYAEAYPWIKPNLLDRLNAGSGTLVTATGISPWLWFLAIAFMTHFFIPPLEVRIDRSFAEEPRPGSEPSERQQRKVR